MHKYHVVIYWSDEDDAYIAEVPELHGVGFIAAHGPTHADALREVNILTEWILDHLKKDGKYIPEPIRKRTEFLDMVQHKFDHDYIIESGLHEHRKSRDKEDKK